MVLGRRLQKELASRKMDVVLVARSQDKLEQLAEKLRSQYNIKAHIIPQDLTKPEATQSVFDAISQQGLTIDLLINNAGFGDYGAFADRPLTKQVQMIQLNITALVELTHLFLNDMKKRGSGAIVNVASIAGYQPLPYCSVYAGTKAFVLNFTEALWAENKDSGVRLLVVCPGRRNLTFLSQQNFLKPFPALDKIMPRRRKLFKTH